MTDLARARRLGRRANHFLLDRSLFAWTHRALGVISGTVFVLAAIVSGHLSMSSLQFRTQRSFSGRSAFLFFVAALPHLVSYSANRDFVDDRTRRTFLYAAGLVIVTGAANVAVVLAFSGGTTFWNLPAILFAEGVAFVVLGHLLLKHDPDRLSARE